MEKIKSPPKSHPPTVNIVSNQPKSLQSQFPNQIITQDISQNITRLIQQSLNPLNHLSLYSHTQSHHKQLRHLQYALELIESTSHELDKIQSSSAPWQESDNQSEFPSEITLISSIVQSTFASIDALDKLINETNKSLIAVHKYISAAEEHYSSCNVSYYYKSFSSFFGSSNSNSAADKYEKLIQWNSTFHNGLEPLDLSNVSIVETNAFFDHIREISAYGFQNSIKEHIPTPQDFDVYFSPLNSVIPTKLTLDEKSDDSIGNNVEKTKISHFVVEKPSIRSHSLLQSVSIDDEILVHNPPRSVSHAGVPHKKKKHSKPHSQHKIASPVFSIEEIDSPSFELSSSMETIDFDQPSMVLPEAIPEDVILNGELYQFSVRTKSFKKQYYQLSKTECKIFANKNSRQHNTLIPLNTVVSAKPFEADLGGPNHFLFQIYLSSKVSYLLSAKSEDQRSKWVSKLEKYKSYKGYLPAPVHHQPKPESEDISFSFLGNDSDSSEPVIPPNQNTNQSNQSKETNQGNINTNSINSQSINLVDSDQTLVNSSLTDSIKTSTQDFPPPSSPTPKSPNQDLFSNSSVGFFQDSHQQDSVSAIHIMTSTSPVKNTVSPMQNLSSLDSLDSQRLSDSSTESTNQPELISVNPEHSVHTINPDSSLRSLPPPPIPQRTTSVISTATTSSSISTVTTDTYQDDDDIYEDDDYYDPSLEPNFDVALENSSKVSDPSKSSSSAKPAQSGSQKKKKSTQLRAGPQRKSSIRKLPVPKRPKGGFKRKFGRLEFKIPDVPIPIIPQTVQSMTPINIFVKFSQGIHCWFIPPKKAKEKCLFKIRFSDEGIPHDFCWLSIAEDGKTPLAYRKNSHRRIMWDEFSHVLYQLSPSVVKHQSDIDFDSQVFLCLIGGKRFVDLEFASQEERDQIGGYFQRFLFETENFESQATIARNRGYI